MKTTDLPIVITETFHTAIEKVWVAITNVEQMREWFFDNIPDFEPIVGFETNFEVTSENRVFTHLWKVTEVIPLKMITYNWKYKEYPGNAFVTFNLTEYGNDVMLQLSMQIVEDFPDAIPEFERESCIGGWNYFIKQNLKSNLDN